MKLMDSLFLLRLTLAIDWCMEEHWAIIAVIRKKSHFPVGIFES